MYWPGTLAKLTEGVKTIRGSLRPARLTVLALNIATYRFSQQSVSRLRRSGNRSAKPCGETRQPALDQ